jgi:hypothetical protein
MAGLVNYNTFDFSSVSEGVDPFVGVSDEQVLVGGRFKTLKRVTVQGRIIPQNFCPNSQSVTSKIKTLLNALKDDFKALRAGGISAQFARCDSIEVNQSNFFGAADYTANFICYPDALSDFNFRVLNPVDNRQIKENPDGTISITRQISAQGLSPNAIANARAFINGVTPTKDKAPDVLLKIGNVTDPGGSLKPRRMIETINRIEGTVSLDIEFLYRSNAPNNNVILSNSVDISYDEKTGIYTVNVQGTLTTGDLSLDSVAIQAALKEALGKITIFNLALGRFKALTSGVYLNPEPESFSIVQDTLNSSLNFNYTYISDPYDVKEDISYEINYDRVKDITSVTVNGTLTARGPQKDKKSKLTAAFNKLNLFSLANGFFEKNAESKDAKLNSNPSNSTVTYNQYEDTVTSLSFSVQFSNQFEENGEIIKFEFTLSATPSIDVYYPIQFLNGNAGIFDMNFFKRGTVGIEGSAISKNKSSDGTVRSLAESKLGGFIGGLGVISRIRVEDNVSRPLESDNGYNYTFSIKENCETEIFKT